MPSKKVEVEVFYEQDPKDPNAVSFVNLRVGDKPKIPLPVDRPTPRRLINDLLAAVTGPATATDATDTNIPAPTVTVGAGSIAGKTTKPTPGANDETRTPGTPAYTEANVQSPGNASPMPNEQTPTDVRAGREGRR
jgi:hypothetical protein